MKKYNKLVIAYYSKELDGEEFQVFVTKDKTTYNVHVCSERYNNDELNTLKLQDDFRDMASVENVNNDEEAKLYYTPAKLAGYLMEHFIWDRFYNEFEAAAISVTIEI